jgi:hypothetical protein
VALPPLLIQAAGSLAAILTLAAFAHWMKLGAAPALNDEAVLRRAVGEVLDGFEVTDFAVAHDHSAALASDSHGQIMLLRRHGSRFAGRILSPLASARVQDDVLEVDCRERRFGVTKLVLVDAEAWADAINRLNQADDA